jgi:hypothetical protein
MKISLIIILIIPFLLIFCGEEKTEAPEKKKVTIKSKEIDACALLDKNEIEKIFNIEMKEPKKGRSQKGGPNQASFSECSFESDTEGTKIFLSVYIRFTPFADENHTTIQTVRSSFKNSGIEVREIDGTGDIAFWGGNQLHVFQGDNYYFIITLLGVNSHDEAISKAITTAQYAVGNLISI